MEIFRRSMMKQKNLKKDVIRYINKNNFIPVYLSLFSCIFQTFIRRVKHKCNAIFLISYIIYNVFHFWYHFISLYLCQIFYCISLDATQCITFETKQITSLQSRKCMLHLHSVFNSFHFFGHVYLSHLHFVKRMWHLILCVGT